jgi:C-terminal processing protease CtpA/Prc
MVVCQKPGGVVVGAVLADSEAAAKGTIEVGDRLHRVNGQFVPAKTTAAAALQRVRQAERPLTLTFERPKPVRIIKSRAPADPHLRAA